MDQQWFFQEPGVKHKNILGAGLAGMMVTQRMTPLARRSGSAEAAGAEGGTFCAVSHSNL